MSFPTSWLPVQEELVGVDADDPPDPGTFEGNPDSKHPVYSTRYGIYSEGCGLDKVMLSWGHDEYLYHICKAQSTLPDEALAMIRYHSFYPWYVALQSSYACTDTDDSVLEGTQQAHTCG